MHRLSTSPPKMNHLVTAAILAGALVASSGISRAGIVLNPGSSGYSNFQVDSTSTSGGNGPTFVNGILFSPGGGFPSLNGSLEGVPPQTSTQSPISTNFVSTATTQPSFFGTATTDLLATLLGGNGASSAQGGIFFNSDTTLADNLAGTQGFASVSIAIATASFTNTGPNAININNPGALLSVSGAVGGASSSYVAAGLTSSFTLSQGNTSLGTTNLGSIALAAQKGGSSVAFNGGGGGSTSASFNSITGLLSATASSTNPAGSITLQVNETISFTATLTLISDPGSVISISTGFAPGFPSGPGDIPTFGIFAGGPNAAAVPEPSTVVLMGLGLAAAGLGARSARGRRPART